MTTKTRATAATRTVAAVIKQTPIRRDQEGRYCLNDLQRAAGGEEKHAPWRFIRLETTAALAEAVSKAPDVVVNPIDLSRGRYGGTYVHEDLAIDYAAWISAAAGAACISFQKQDRCRPGAGVNKSANLGEKTTEREP